MPVVRSVEINYKKPAQGSVSSIAEMSQDEIEKAHNSLKTKSRAMIDVNVKVLDSDDIITMIAKFTWYVQIMN